MQSPPIGILGGTFDPVHHGHLRLAVEMLERLALHSVRLIPLNIPPHRRAPVAPATLRLAMLEAAVQDEPRLIVDPREVRRDGMSYTVDTLTEFREEVGATPLCLIVGMDAFLGLPSWHRWEALIELAHVVVADRPAATTRAPEPLARLLEQRIAHDHHDLHRGPAGRIFMLQCPKLEISASAVRTLIAAGRDPRYLLPERALALIETHNLYRDVRP